MDRSARPSTDRRLRQLVLGCTLVAALAAAAGFVGAAAASDRGSRADAPPADAGHAPPEAVPGPPAAATAAPSTTHRPGHDPTALRPGARGPEVLALQRTLLGLGYWQPAADGTYGSATQQAVMAFQGVAGIGRDGSAGAATRAALATARRPTPAKAADGTRIVDGLEIDLRKQVILVIRGGAVRWVLHTSTGRGGASETPVGRFVVQRDIDGVRRAALGELYRPKYFNGGIAIHGAGSVPGRPASHGCARVTDEAMDLIWREGHAPIGAPVWVR